MPCQKNLGVFCGTSDPSLCVLGNGWVGQRPLSIEPWKENLVGAQIGRCHTTCAQAPQKLLGFRLGP